MRTLIVARLDPSATDAVAALFRKSDTGGLPHRIGVTRRTLFTYQGLYFHLVESDADLPARLREARTDPRYEELNTGLAEHVVPYSPTWREPGDAMATPFYSWQPGDRTTDREG
jgi:cyclase